MENKKLWKIVTNRGYTHSETFVEKHTEAEAKEWLYDIAKCVPGCHFLLYKEDDEWVAYLGPISYIDKEDIVCQ